MKQYLSNKSLLIHFALFATALAITGCAGGKAERKEDKFFTSGSREADQRASQRMARDEQLTASAPADGKEKPKKSDSNQASVAPAKLTLFQRLGAEEGISKIVEDFTPRVLQDPRVNWAREGVKKGGFSLQRNRTVEWQATPQNINLLKRHMAQFLSLATGGPSKYQGKEIKAAHAGMKITNPEFDAVIGDLKATLDRLQIANQEQKELLAIVESTRPLIVTQR